MDRRNAGAYLGHSPKTLANWHSQGIGPKCYFVSGKAFYYRSDLDAFIRGETAVYRGLFAAELSACTISVNQR